MNINELKSLFEYYLNNPRNQLLFINPELRGKIFEVSLSESSSHISYSVYTVENNTNKFIASDMIFARNEDNIFQLCDELILGINNGFPIQGYNFMIPSLTSAYHDVDTIMFHAVFECLRIFVEDEKCFDVIDWAEKENIATEIKYLYNWFKSSQTVDDIAPEVITEHMIRCVKIREYLWS